jgi:hypothetical protein
MGGGGERREGVGLANYTHGLKIEANGKSRKPIVSCRKRHVLSILVFGHKSTGARDASIHLCLISFHNYFFEVK